MTQLDTEPRERIDAALSATADNDAWLAGRDMQREVELLKLVTQHCNVDQIKAITYGMLAARSKPIADLVAERHRIAKAAADEATARERERCAKIVEAWFGNQQTEAAAIAVGMLATTIRTPDAGEGGE